MTSNQPMNQMNQMYLVGIDWAEILQFCRRAAQLEALNAENTIFCTYLGSESGSSMYIWFIGDVWGSLSIFFNEPNVHECSKCCSMRVFAMSVFRVWKGWNRAVFGAVFGMSDELDSGPMYIKFIGA